MQGGTDDGFSALETESRPFLALIARHTAGEHTLDDVRHEAWLLARELQEKGVIDHFDREPGRTLLLKYLYQKLVRYTDTRVRFAERFEARPSYEDSTGDRNPLLDRLASDSSVEPLEILLAHESSGDVSDEPPSHESRASAFIVLLRAYDNNMTKLADYLLISVSHCYRCYAKARYLAISQRPLRAPMTASEEELMPRRWRRFRMVGRERIEAEVRDAQYQLI